MAKAKLVTADQRAAILALHASNTPLATIARVLKLTQTACRTAMGVVAAAQRPLPVPPVHNLDLTPYESELLGAEVKKLGFGYSWYERTRGHIAIRVEWTRRGIQSIAVHARTQAKFASTGTASWFILLDGEYITELRVRESEARDRITSLCIQTNKRRSQWFGSAHGEVRKIEAPIDFYIHSIHGSHHNGACESLGAYFVPLTLRKPPTKKDVVSIADSPIIGDMAYDKTTPHNIRFNHGSIREIILTVAPHLTSIRPIHHLAYQRCLAVTEAPLNDGDSSLALVEGELVIGLRACVVEDSISAIQFETTFRTTEWFGPAPQPGARIELRHIRDEPTATFIGGIFGMRVSGKYKSIGVTFYKRK